MQQLSVLAQINEKQESIKYYNFLQVFNFSYQELTRQKAKF